MGPGAGYWAIIIWYLSFYLVLLSSAGGRRRAFLSRQISEFR